MPCFSTCSGPLRNREPAQTVCQAQATVVTVVVIVIVAVIVVLVLLSPVTTTLSSSLPHPCREREAITPKTTAANARRNCMIKDRSRRIVCNDRSKPFRKSLCLNQMQHRITSVNPPHVTEYDFTERFVKLRFFSAEF